MKIIQLLLISILNFSLINSTNKIFQKHLQKISNLKVRKLAETINKLMLVGFGEYNGETFKVYFKNYNNSFSYKDLNFLTTISYENGQNVTNINCTTINPINGDDIIYSCPSENLNGTKKVKINGSYKFYNKSVQKEIKVIESSLANTSKYDILSRKTPLNIKTFYFENVSVSGNNAEINGNSGENIGNKNYILNSTVESYNCSFTDKKIKFNLTNTVKEHLIGNLLYTDSNEPEILIFSNETIDDLLAYSNYTTVRGTTYFFGYDNYTNPTDKTNATNRVHFRGSFDKLKKYLRFTARIRRSSSLRLLQEYINVTANGVRDDTNSDLNYGKFIYNVTYENTINMDIIEIERTSNFNFSDDNSKDSSFSSIDVYDVTNGTSDLMETESTDYEPFNLENSEDSTNKNGTSFSFDINIPNNITNLNEKKASLSYISINENKRNETNQCSIKKNGNNNYDYKLICSPKHDINAPFSSIIIKIPINIQNRLRILQSSANNIQLYPENNPTENINFIYKPNVKTYERDKKGLSGGAIAAIVLATVAVVAAIGAILFFFNRKGPSVKTSTNPNFQESSTNINN